MEQDHFEKIARYFQTAFGFCSDPIEPFVPATGTTLFGHRLSQPVTQKIRNKYRVFRRECPPTAHLLQRMGTKRAHFRSLLFLSLGGPMLSRPTDISPQLPTDISPQLPTDIGRR
jgi:hypothetical protein